ncbi:hypothetical protein LguiA_022166 [Lonicera macranthoides]
MGGSIELILKIMGEIFTIAGYFSLNPTSSAWSTIFTFSAQQARETTSGIGNMEYMKEEVKNFKLKKLQRLGMIGNRKDRVGERVFKKPSKDD